MVLAVLGHGWTWGAQRLFPPQQFCVCNTELLPGTQCESLLTICVVRALQAGERVLRTLIPVEQFQSTVCSLGRASCCWGRLGLPALLASAWRLPEQWPAAAPALTAPQLINTHSSIPLLEWLLNYLHFELHKWLPNSITSAPLPASC